MSEKQLTIQGKTQALKTLLERSKKEIAAALPRHLTPERMLRIAVTELRRNPKLTECSQTSFIGAIIQCAQLGLEPGNEMGHAYLVPFYNSKTKQSDVAFIPGYKGLLHLANQSPKTEYAIAYAVYDCDEFDYAYGSNPFITHKPSKDSQGKKVLTHTYALCFVKGASRPMFIVLGIDEIEKHRANSKSGNVGPWKDHYEEMALKCAIRDLFKFMPSSIEIQRAIALDQAGDRGEQDNSSVIDIEPVASETDAARDALRGKTALPPSEPEPSEEDLALPVSDK